MASFIENAEEIKERLDPREVLELVQPGKIRPSGGELRCACPIHGGDGENFALNESTHHFYCQSKGCKGKNLVDLYIQCTGVSYQEALEALATEFGIGVIYKDPSAAMRSPTIIRNPSPRPPSNRPEVKPSKSYSQEDVVRSWDEAAPQGKDTYFSKKGIPVPPIARFGKNPKGYYSTLIPLRDVDGGFKGVISLSEGGKFNFGHELKGSFALLGQLDPIGSFYIGEGIATMATAWEATQRKIPAVSCGSWINIEPVILAIKAEHPNAKPIQLIDCDAGGRGLEAAKLVLAKFPDTTFRKPSFESFPTVEGKKPTDFNDIISMCNQPIEVVLEQLKVEFRLPVEEESIHSKEEPLDPHTERIDLFYKRLGVLVNDPGFSLQLKDRNYDVFEQEHKRLFSSGGLITGFKDIDDQLYFAKGDFVVVQAMSNHGKSTFMLQMAYRFLTEGENRDRDPMCLFVTYESMPIRIEEKLVNIIGHGREKQAPILYDRNSEEKYRYPDRKEYQGTISEFNRLQKENMIHILKSTPLENLDDIINIYKEAYPGRTLILFLDYFQIIDTTIKSEGWERIKAIAYTLETLAIKKEVIIISACQVNENRQTREGRDIYNAATTIIDIFNHSHISLKNNRDLEKLYKAPVNGKNVCTFSAVKQKHGPSFDLPGYFLFNGYGFEANNDSNSIKF